MNSSTALATPSSSPVQNTYCAMSNAEYCPPLCLKRKSALCIHPEWREHKKKIWKIQFKNTIRGQLGTHSNVRQTTQFTVTWDLSFLRMREFYVQNIFRLAVWRLVQHEWRYQWSLLSDYNSSLWNVRLLSTSKMRKMLKQFGVGMILHIWGQLN